MGDRRFRALREEDADAVAALHACAREAVRESIRAAPQFVERVTCDDAVRVFVDQCEAAAAIGPFVARVDADVVVRGNPPGEALDELGVMGGVGQHRASPVVFSYAVSMHSTPNRRAYARALGSIL